MSEPRKLSLRLRLDLFDRLEPLRQALINDDRRAGYFRPKVTRTDVIEKALQIGLKELEARHLASDDGRPASDKPRGVSD